MKTIKSIILLFSLAFAFNLAYANVLLLDFGPTVPTGAETNSPAHQVEAISLSDTTWNIVGTTAGSGGTESSLLYGDGSTAAGVSFTYGVSALDVKTLAFDGSNGTIASSNALGAGTLGSAYDGDTPAKDGIWTGSGNTDYSIGVRVDGLSAGDYDLYLLGRNTNTIVARPTNVFASALDSSSTYDFSGETPKLITNPGAVTEWVDGESYALVSVTLGTSQSIFIAFDGDDSGSDSRGFMNAIQIVSSTAAVPERSTVSASFGLLIGGIVFYIRRKKIS